MAIANISDRTTPCAQSQVVVVIIGGSCHHLKHHTQHTLQPPFCCWPISPTTQLTVKPSTRISLRGRPRQPSSAICRHGIGRGRDSLKRHGIGRHGAGPLQLQGRRPRRLPRLRRVRLPNSPEQVAVGINVVDFRHVQSQVFDVPVIELPSGTLPNTVQTVQGWVRIRWPCEKLAVTNQ